MKNDLTGLRIAILATDGFEQSELQKPREALNQAGATTVVVSPADDEITGWNTDDWGESVEVDLALAEANAADFDALLLPGGVMNPDKLRVLPEAVNFVRAFFEAGKPVAAICHGLQVVIEARVLHNRTVTSIPSIKTDLRNAGAHWVDKDVVTDQGLVTSRKPDDIPRFNQKMIEEFAVGLQRRQAESVAAAT